MADVQLYLSVGLPTLLVIASLVVNIITISGMRDSVREAREDTRQTRTDVNVSVAQIREDLREIRSDIKLLIGKVYELMGEKH